MQKSYSTSFCNLGFLTSQRYSTDDEVKIYQFSQISANCQEWSGRVEISVDPVDWFAHVYHRDAEYKSVIWNVVCSNPVSVVYLEAYIAISCLAVASFVTTQVLDHYRGIMQTLHWILVKTPVGEIFCIKT